MTVRPTAQYGPITGNTPAQYGAAFRVICRRTKTRTDEDHALWMLGIHYKPQPQDGDPRQ